MKDRVAAERAAIGKLSDLAEERQKALDRLLLAADRPDPSLLSAASGWLIWADQEHQRLNLELAQRRAELAAEQSKARKAFGKMQAAEKLLESELARLRKFPLA
ncbi:hypothetical protein [Tropicimonas marinistellae]|uniref:hypothetical protein n=1 Tax=Tropicimonas marinistellae TaxID=1739787 RepID=UPI00122DEB0C|nr:hypothetical protein [Tropicimonas marinistellae]